MPAPVPVGASPIQSVLLVGRLRHPAAHSFRASSLPGHLIHAVIAGEVRQECNGRAYHLRPGSVLWYHEDETVVGRVVKGPWIFYTVNFIAPTLPPPAFEARLFAGRRPLLKKFHALLEAWQNMARPVGIRAFRIQALLLQILAELNSAPQPPRMDPQARLWWELETDLRKDLRQPINLDVLRRLSRRSPATIARACLCAVGMPPLKRVKQVRMSLARGLVRNSELTMTEIGDRVGYVRVHEFSRDYHKHFGRAPSRDREKREGPSPDRRAAP